MEYKVHIINADCCCCGLHSEIGSFDPNFKLQIANLSDGWGMDKSGRFYCNFCLDKLRFISENPENK